MKKKELKLKIKDLETQIATLKFNLDQANWQRHLEKVERLKWHGRFFDLLEDKKDE